MLHAFIPLPYTYTAVRQTLCLILVFYSFLHTKKIPIGARKQPGKLRHTQDKKKALFFTNEEKLHKGCAFEAESIHLSFTESTPHLFIYLILSVRSG